MIYAYIYIYIYIHNVMIYSVYSVSYRSIVYSHGITVSFQNFTFVVAA